ncbi:MAG: hypothetical protein LWW87_12350 [Geobacteraceae bacterium]|nr:hypothetical protein [Geobacteraceae bacterium]
MICPICKTEYQDGYYTCADCSVPLVVTPPKQNLKKVPTAKSQLNTGDFAEVFQTIDQSAYLTVKLAFDEEGIPNNNSGGILLCSEWALVRFFVPTEYKAKALNILRNLGYT